MPLGVQSITYLDDGFTIVSRKGTWTFTSADVPANVTDPAQAETWANSWLASRTQPEFYAYVHVTSLDPLQCIVATSSTPLSGSWWTHVGQGAA